MAWVYHEWMAECMEIIKEEDDEEEFDNMLLALAMARETQKPKRTKRIYTKKRFWIHPIFRLRNQHGFYHAIFPTLSRHEPKFQNYMRMSAVQFEELLCIVGPHIAKKHVVRETISAPARLSMTLRYVTNNPLYVRRYISSIILTNKYLNGENIL